MLPIVKDAFLTLGAICGIFSVAWQLYIAQTRALNKLHLEPAIMVEDDGTTFRFLARASNMGNAPVFIEVVHLTTEPKYYFPGTKAILSYDLTSGSNPDEPLPVGATRDFTSDQFSRADLERLIRDHGEELRIIFRAEGHTKEIADFGDTLRRVLLGQLPEISGPLMFPLSDGANLEWKRY